MKKKKKTIKTWEVIGYYFDGRQAWTHLQSLKDRVKMKRIKGIV